MAFRVCGNEVKDASGKVLETCETHRDASGVAAHRAKSSDGSSAGLAGVDSVRVQIALDFGKGGDGVVVERVDEEAHRLLLLAAETDPEKIKDIVKGSGPEPHRRRGRYRMLQESVVRDGATLEAGKGVVVLVDVSRKVELYPSLEAMGKAWKITTKAPAAPAQAAEAKKETK